MAPDNDSDSQAGVILSAFADEAVESKQAPEQLAVMAALGLEYYSVRFVDLGSGVKNIMKLDAHEVSTLNDLHKHFGLKVASIGSPIGKVKLVDRDDGSNNTYKPFWKYLEEDVRTAIDRAHGLDTRLIRGFSFYPPKGDDPDNYLSQSIEQVGKIAEMCRREGLVYGLELEANLVGDCAERLVAIAGAINVRSLVLVFDGGNLAAQNLPREECLRQFVAMRDYIGWIHVKDYRIDPELKWDGHVDEGRLKNFVPCGFGDAGYELVFRDLTEHLAYLTARMQAFGAPGFFLDLEPHLKGGGQFGGFSGPDGMGIALRALTSSLEEAVLPYRPLRTFDRIVRN